MHPRKSKENQQGQPLLQQKDSMVQAWVPTKEKKRGLQADGEAAAQGEEEDFP